jgi:hypothetical protein
VACERERERREDNDTSKRAIIERTMSEEKEKVALITGITGQDGSYLAELLLGKGYTVRGLLYVVFGRL